MGDEGVAWVDDGIVASLTIVESEGVVEGDVEGAARACYGPE